MIFLDKSQASLKLSVILVFSLLSFTLFKASAKENPIFGSWVGYHTAENASFPTSAEVYVWNTSENKIKAVFFYEYEGCYLELTLTANTMKSLEFSAKNIKNSHICRVEKMVLSPIDSGLEWNMYVPNKGKFYEQGELKKDVLSEQMQHLLATKYQIKATLEEKPELTKKQPLNSPIGWYLVNENGLHEIIEDDRYYHTAEWKQVRTRTLDSTLYTQLNGQITSQGAWSNKRQDFSIQGLVYMPNLPECSYFGKEYNTQIYVPEFKQIRDNQTLVYRRSEAYNKSYTAPPDVCINAKVDKVTCKVYSCNQWEDEKERSFSYILQKKDKAMWLNQRLNGSH
ncbi:hypothetical protein AB6T38_02395 [Aliiglaciecola sp. SL4]|uniref:hypothetical protein n=1 Tax=Aliiglaciecola sp. SL4 TaxID=3239806 RepID=UPI00355B9284